MKKFFLSLFCIFFVPVTVLVFRAFDPLDPAPHFNPRFWICCLIYLSIILYCFSFLLKNRPSVKSIILSLLVGGITLGYGLPLDYPPQFILCLSVCFATMVCFLQIISPAWHTKHYFEWNQKGWKNNLRILSVITVSCLILYLLEHGWVFHFSLSNSFSALAAGVSEELIFRVFLPILIYTRLKVRATACNQLWVFIIITIPFALMHLDYYASLDFSKALDYVFGIGVPVGAFSFLIKKYGIIYGIYAHCFFDFLLLNRVAG